MKKVYFQISNLYLFYISSSPQNSIKVEMAANDLTLAPILISQKFCTIKVRRWRHLLHIKLSLHFLILTSIATACFAADFETSS